MSYSYHDKTALITGASSGIGTAFARALASRGMHLILVARSEGRLQALAEELGGNYGVRTAVVKADLAAPDAVDTIRQAIRQKGLRVDMLVNNAGFGTYGRFETLPAERERDEILVNTLAVVELTRAFLPTMQEAGDGAVINVASTSAFQPTPLMATYGATKAFVLSFSEALWAENRNRGVGVLALCPGPTSTAFFEAVDSSDFQGPPLPALTMTAGQVVNRALHALQRGRSYVVPGPLNYLGALSTRLGPRSLVARLTERVMSTRHR